MSDIVKFVRLVTGEDIMGEITDSGDTYSIKYPAQLTMALPRNIDPTKPPVPSFGFMPWWVTQYAGIMTNDTVVVKKVHVFWEPSVALQDITDVYVDVAAKIYGRKGLVQAPKTSLILP